MQEKESTFDSESYEKMQEKWRLSAMNLLSYRMRTRSELREKLIEKGAPEEMARAIVREMEALKYVDDTVYAENYIRAKQRRFGKWRIETELKRKGVADSAISGAYALLEEEREVLSEEAAASDILKRKVETLSVDRTQYAEDRLYRMKIQRKLYAFLSGRGFSAEIIRRVLDPDEFFDES
ncbi:MAG: regulatory protein [Clostridiales bacterium]|jgi:regulatory protein|nr:regulatory protein [Clostridiales bacterium]